MSQIISVNKHLQIELLPSLDDNEPALCLNTLGESKQSLVVFLSEIYLLRDALAEAGARLTELEAEVRHKR
jgi:hypothetical protein